MSFGVRRVLLSVKPRFPEYLVTVNRLPVTSRGEYVTAPPIFVTINGVQVVINGVPVIETRNY